MGLETRVLIVDDNVDAADLTAEYLRVFGANVTVAYGGAEALAIAKVCSPTLIFLDIGMPEIDGYAVAKTLRADAAFAGVKIVALTAWGDSVSRARSKEAGFDLHITKPANLSLLLSLST